MCRHTSAVAASAAYGYAAAACADAPAPSRSMEPERKTMTTCERSTCASSCEQAGGTRAVKDWRPMPRCVA
eukprot:3297766-Prymnesium_polylepis.2